MAEGEERPGGGGDDEKGKRPIGFCGEESPGGGGDDDEEGKYPIGFRFDPTLEELVKLYLLPKLLDQPTVPNEFVIAANAYEFDPETLTKKYKERGVDNDNWYFLSPRTRRYPGGDRPARRTADDRGRWKPSTGQSKAPDEKNAASPSNSKGKKKFCVGDTTFTENTLAYYVGSPKNETKTKWLMHELVVPKTPKNGLGGSKSAGEASSDMLLDKCVVCRIYKSPLRKWKEGEGEEKEEGNTSTSSASEAEVPTSSQASPSWSTPGSLLGETAAAQAPANKRRAVKMPAAPSMPVSQRTLFPDGPFLAAPTHGNGGGSVRMPVGAAGHHGVLPDQLPAVMQWPPAYNSMQGPVQVVQRARPPLMHGYNNGAVGMPRAPLMRGYSNGAAGMPRPPLMHRYSNGAAGMPRRPFMHGCSNRAVRVPNGQAQAPPGMQGQLPVLTLEPPRRAAATAPNSRGGGPTMMMRPQNLAAGQSARPPAPPPETDAETEAMKAYTLRVATRLVAEMKLQNALKEQDSAACAGQQQIRQTSSRHPACFHCAGGSHPAGAGLQAMAPPAQFPAPHSSYPDNSSSDLARQPQRQQSTSVTPAAVGTPAAENAPCAESVPGAASEGDGYWDDEAMAELVR